MDQTFLGIPLTTWVVLLPVISTLVGAVSGGLVNLIRTRHTVSLEKFQSQKAEFQMYQAAQAEVVEQLQSEIARVNRDRADDQARYEADLEGMRSVLRKQDRDMSNLYNEIAALRKVNATMLEKQAQRDREFAALRQELALERESNLVTQKKSNAQEDIIRQQEARIAVLETQVAELTDERDLLIVEIRKFNPSFDPTLRRKGDKPRDTGPLKKA